MLDVACALPLLVARLPGLQAVYLFGSAATDEQRADSDVDLAVLSPSPLASDLRFSLQQSLAALLRRDVDLVDLRMASTVLRTEVLRRGVLVHDGAPTERALFEAHALSDYARLNEERREILDDIRARGRVYG